MRARLILLEREPRTRQWQRAGRTLTFDDDAMQSGEEKAEANGKWWLRQGPGGSRDYTILRRRTRPELSKALARVGPSRTDTEAGSELSSRSSMPKG